MYPFFDPPFDYFGLWRLYSWIIVPYSQEILLQMNMLYWGRIILPIVNSTKLINTCVVVIIVDAHGIRLFGVDFSKERGRRKYIRG